VSRQVTDRSKLGLLIRRSGKPMYVVAAEARIAFSQLSRYANLYEPIRPNHVVRLTQYFGVPIDELVGIPDTGGPGGGTQKVDG
jgi:hypothetical protein